MKILKPEDLILHEDEDLILLNKPPHLTSEKDNAPGAKSLQDIIRKLIPSARLCHRLDRETSGIIVAAKTNEAYRYMSILFQKRQIEKEYHAIGTGVHRFADLLIDLPLGKQGSAKAIIAYLEGKKAETLVNTLENFRHYTLIQALPTTGRFHQIRVHLAAKGCSLLGDNIYGGKPLLLSSIKRKYKLSKDAEEELPVISRAALHAYALKFNHPSGNEIIIKAPYPKDFEVALRLLRKHDTLI
ncbi:MAG: RluA family pseudouridine synthase [Bacteroidota bacterium]|nr:RluA family pseudouridine synthase [Bacteroidota bacterium]